MVAPPIEEPPPARNTEVHTPLSLPLPNIPVGGRLAHFAQDWAKITDDKWVLSVIRDGYRIPFLERPILSPDPVFFQQPLSQHLEEEVASLLSKGAVEEIIPECPGHYSRIFLVPKKNGKLRLIIDLSALNHFVYTLFHGLWTEDQSRLHINVLEMKAIFLSLSQAVHKVKNTTVLVSTDNTKVVAYIRHQGGTHSTELSEEAWNVLSLCFNRNIQLLVKHIPGRFNTLADRMSRVDKPISTEWSLNQEIANKVFQIMDFPSIDLFATRLNHRLPFYVSPIPDQKVLSIDALSMDWNSIHAYAFPPFHLIPAVINKIRLSQCKIVLIAPLWPDRPWFPELLSLLVSPPVSLPVIPNLLAQLKGRILHQNPGHLQLHAWELSNNHCEIDNFQAMLRSTSPKPEENRLLKSMMQNGKSSVVGQINGRLILSRPLQAWGQLL